MANENILTPALTKPDDQILPFAAWVPIGKSNFVLDLQKKQKNPIFQISMDILQNTNFFRAFTISALLDEDWFRLDANLLMEALEITLVDQAHQFVSPPSGDAIMDFVNQLGYPWEIHFVSRMAVNNFYQPWRAILTMINQCLTCKTFGFDRPRYPVLQMLWGIITRINIDNVELMWEEFVQAIHTFLVDNVNLGSPTKKGKKTKPHVIPYSQFTKLIIYHLARHHNIHQMSKYPLTLAKDDLNLGNLKFIPKGIAATKDGGKKKTTPKADKPVKPAPAKQAKPATVKRPKPKPIKEYPTKPTPLQKSSKGKRRAPATKEASTGPSIQPQDNTSANVIYETSSPTEAKTSADMDKTVILDEGQAGSEPDKTPESQPPPDDDKMDKDQAGSDPGKSHVALTEPNPEPMYDDFVATVYLKVRESLKFSADEHVILEDPPSLSGTLSSMKNLNDTYTFGDQFFNDKSTKDEPGKQNIDAEVVSMVTVPIHQASTSVPPLSTHIIDLLPPKPAASPLPKPFTTATTKSNTTTLSLSPPPQRQSTTLVVC
uniref:Monodehydroascorbate reductase n=1 Tax=Tanacetum cinerariifolium TaxID=118510 RepID=A0A699HCN5_TANCI|nr:hypothetical protein [Tanacetum cinerariifolium]